MEYQMIKITNPNWLRFVTKEVETLCGKLQIPAITSQSLWAYFAESMGRGAMQKAQLGIELEEFWAVFSGDLTMENPDDSPRCHAFAHWFKAGLPHVGTVICDAIYSWNRKADPAEMLYKEFVEFGKRLRCTYYMAECANKELFRLFHMKLEKLGIKIVQTGRIQFVGRL